MDASVLPIGIGVDDPGEEPHLNARVMAELVEQHLEGFGIESDGADGTPF